MRIVTRSIVAALLACATFDGTRAERAADSLLVDREDDNAAASDCADDVENDCTLRGAIRRANSTPGADTIVLPAGVYALNSPGADENAANTGDLDITDALTLTGAGASTTVITAVSGDRVLHIDPNATGVTASISGVTIQGGSTFIMAFVDPAGAGVLIGSTQTAGDPPPSGTLTLTDSIVQGNVNHEGRGGGIANKAGTLHLIRTIVRNNTSHTGAAGIYHRFIATTTIADSRISGNTVDFTGPGGGIHVFGGQFTMTGSTVDGNATPSEGGGIARDYGVVTIANSTISGNDAGDGAGLWLGPNDQTLNVIKNTTIANNRAHGLVGFGGSGGGISNGGQVAIANTIAAGNTRDGVSGPTGSDCIGTLISRGYNLIHIPGTPCGVTGDGTGNIIGQAAGLGPLANNGGPTPTHALVVGSVAIDAGGPAAGSTTDGACESVDQRGRTRPEDGNNDGIARCDMGAYEAAPGTTIDGVAPGHAGNVGPVCATILGNGFADGATVKLTRAGEQDIPGTPANVLPGGTVIAAAFNLKGKAAGHWNVVVTNPDGSSATLDEGFTVDEGGAPLLWHEIIGPPQIRAGRTTRVFFFYGNRGNVDAIGVPLMIAAPRHINLKLMFDVLPPPTLPGQAPIDWTKFPMEFNSDEPPDETIVPLFVPLVPAGYTGVLEFTVTPPSDDASIGQKLRVYPGIGSPWFTADGSDSDDAPDVDEGITSDFIAGAEGYARRVLNFTEPFDRDFAGRYLGTLLDAIVQDGGARWIESGGGSTSDGIGSIPTYDLSWINIDGSLTTTGRRTSIPEPAVGLGGSCGESGWQACAPPPCTSTTGKKRPPGRACSCPWDFDIRRSHDPNDKIGSQQGGGRLVSGEEPLRYAVTFENDALLANAPAQEVVITDHLDLATLDINTFSLGSMSFGTHSVTPAAGLSAFSTDVDLRPGTNLLVRITARLDKTTGVATWRFASLDPITQEPPEDPDAGFLPPNTLPPEGDGSVMFTVRHRPGLAVGTNICNRAEIVFDTNAPIVTPQWCNTLDDERPASQVVSPSSSPVSPSFTVQWAGTDTGSGIQDYSIFVSENGGPFVPFVAFTEQTTATFNGLVGSTYSFYSVARDKTLNIENPPLLPDVTVTVTDTTPPTVTPPASIAVPATESGGTRAGASAALAAFLAAGSAIDNVDPTVTRLTPQVGGVDVTNTTLFPLGTTLVTFRFRDANGNIGIAQSAVTVALGTIRITGSIVGTGVHATGILYVDLRIANTGTGHARSVLLKQLALKTLAGSGSVTLNSLSPPLPHTIGSLGPGASTVLRLYLNVPNTVTRFSITESGSLQNVAGNSFSFSASQSVIR